MLQRASGFRRRLREVQEMVRLQGGDVAALDELPQASRPPSCRSPCRAPKAGYHRRAWTPRAIGRACWCSARGRAKTDDKVDYAVGVSGLAKIGEQVDKGQPLVVMHANDETSPGRSPQAVETGVHHAGPGQDAAAAHASDRIEENAITR